jgi:hypothetical protein
MTSGAGARGEAYADGGRAPSALRSFRDLCGGGVASVPTECGSGSERAPAASMTDEADLRASSCSADDDVRV